MSGRPGRSGGWNKLSPEEHALRGTKPRKPPGQAPFDPWAILGPDKPSQKVKPPDPMPPALLEGLSGPGHDFVVQCWDAYRNWLPSSLLLLHEAGRLRDELELARSTPAEHQVQRMLLKVLAALRLE